MSYFDQRGLEPEYIEKIIFRKNPYSIVIIFKSGNGIDAKAPNYEVWQNLMDEAIESGIRIEL